MRSSTRPYAFYSEPGHPYENNEGVVLMSVLNIFWVRGVHYRQEECIKVSAADPVLLEREPDNRFDANAVMVKVLVEGLHRAEVLDYLPLANSLDARVRPLIVTDGGILETRAQMKIALRRFREFVSLNR